MNVLIVCNANLHWVHRFVKEVLFPRGDFVNIVSVSNEKYKDWYVQNNVLVTTVRDDHKLFDRIKYIRTISALTRMKRFVEKSRADLIIEIYPSWMLNAILNFSKNNIRIVLCYIGSDLLRVSKPKLLLGKWGISKMKNVVFTSHNLKDVFDDAYGSSYKGKGYVIDFGMSHLDNIDNLEISIDECRKKYLGESNNTKILVALGYNARDAQQVDKVLGKLKELHESIKEKIKLLIPMQYGECSDQYQSSVYALANQIGIESEIITEYYTGDQVAVFAKATDIFINSQTTDSLSAAVVEHLYAGTVMLSASWLPYEYLDNLGVYYEIFSDFEVLITKLTEIVTDIGNFRNKAYGNHAAMLNQFSWKKCREEWSKIIVEYEK